MKALVADCRRPEATARIALVLSNRPGAEGLAFAEEAGLATAVVDHKAHATRDAFDAALDDRLREAGIELICLAGFMRILTPWFVERWRNRLLNIHPSLLPAFKGLHTHERALEAGVRVHGCSVHIVRPDLDDGPILVQGVVPVNQEDTVDDLAARVLIAEHRCYPLALDLMASGKVQIDGDRLTIEGGTPKLVSLIEPDET